MCLCNQELVYNTSQEVKDSALIFKNTDSVTFRLPQDVSLLNEGVLTFVWYFILYNQS